MRPAAEPTSGPKQGPAGTEEHQYEGLDAGTEKIELGYVVLFVLRNWKLLAFCTLLPVALVVVLLGFVAPKQYEAVASLVAHPRSEDSIKSQEFYISLLGSDAVVEETTARLVGEGVLAEDRRLRINRDLFVIPETAAIPQFQALRLQLPTSQFVLSLRARAQDPEAAATTANTWAEVFVEQSRRMAPSLAAARQSKLDEQLPAVRSRLEELEAERSAITEDYGKRELLVIEDFQKREERTSGDWDLRISVAEKKAESALAEYQIQSRALMESSLMSFLEEIPESADAAELRIKLLQIVSIRAELSKTPRVLTLEKAASDETLAELLMEPDNADRFDHTLVSQELNPLYDQLAISALELEGELKRQAGRRLGEVSGVLGRLEKLQLERSAGLVALAAENRVKLRRLRRQRSFALNTLARQGENALREVELEREKVLAEIDRRHEQLRDFEKQVAEQLNASVLSGWYEDVGSVTLASRAGPSPELVGRLRASAILAVALLGGFLGVLIAVIRSARGGSAPVH